MVDLTVPQWLEDATDLYCELLGLGDYVIKLSLSICVNNTPFAHASCHQQPRLNMAELEFRVDVEDTQEWHATLLHELLHVKHMRIDQTVYQIIERMPESSQSFMSDAYCESVMEPFIDSLAEALTKVFYPIYCGSRDDDEPETNESTDEVSEDADQPSGT